MAKQLSTRVLDWYGEKRSLTLYKLDDEKEIASLTNIRQAQAVTFLDPEHVVVYQHAKGHYGLPGGRIEEGESPFQALEREVMEESACKVLQAGLVGYIEDKPVVGVDASDAVQDLAPVGKEARGTVRHLLRYWALVELVEQAVADPDQKAIGREIIPVDEVAERLGWGEQGEQLVELARTGLKRFLTDQNKTDQKRA